MPWWFRYLNETGIIDSLSSGSHTEIPLKIFANRTKKKGKITLRLPVRTYAALKGMTKTPTTKSATAKLMMKRFDTCYTVEKRLTKNYQSVYFEIYIFLQCLTYSTHALNLCSFISNQQKSLDFQNNAERFNQEKLDQKLYQEVHNKVSFFLIQYFTIWSIALVWCNQHLLDQWEWLN